MTVSEIKGAPCTRRAHFHGRVHDFRRCAPGVCTFFEPFIIAIYWEGAWNNFRVHSFRGSAPCECTKLKLNFGHCMSGSRQRNTVIHKNITHRCARAGKFRGLSISRAPGPQEYLEPTTHGLKDSIIHLG